MASHILFSSTTTTSTRCGRHDSIYKKSNPFSLQVTTHNLQSQWLGISKFPLNCSNTRPIITSSLPTANPERVNSSEKVPQWSLKGIKSFAMGELEARKLKFSTTGTEAILMGILVEGTNRGSKLLRANGFTLAKVREEAIKLIGKPDYFFFSPEHPPLTQSAQRALDWALNQSGNHGEITASHLLLGVWSEKEAAGHTILATLGFNDELAQQLHSLISKPGFLED